MNVLILNQAFHPDVVSTAQHASDLASGLTQAGHEVTVLERQPAAGMETSFANGGQISVSHVEPWANPAAPAQILRWLGREDAPLLFRLRADWR